jgi:hypothetical protein
MGAEPRSAEPGQPGHPVGCRLRVMGLAWANTGRQGSVLWSWAGELAPVRLCNRAATANATMRAMRAGYQKPGDEAS